MKKIIKVIVFIVMPVFVIGQVKTIALDTTIFDIIEIEETEYSHIPADDNYDFIEDQLSCLEQTIPLNYNARVHGFVNHFITKDRAFTEKIIRRKEFYFPVFEKYLAQYGLPDELKYLSIIESGLNPRAVSSARAVGLWQFMSYTGSSFGLHQDNYIDERMDYERSTEAACKYLKQLYGMFNDWELAIAAYNTGPGNVRKAMRRSGKNKFWDIYPYLHRETRAYLPQFVAVVYVLNHLEEYSFEEQPELYFVNYDTLMLKKYVHIPTLATLMNLCPEEILNINTGLKFNAFPDLQKPYPFRIPSFAISTLTENRSLFLDSASQVEKSKVLALARSTGGSTYGKEKIVYRVRSGDVLGKIAMNHRVRVSDLKRWNNLSSDMIRVGQRLDIWLKPGSFVPKKAAPVAAQKKVIEHNTLTGVKTYVVQYGDTLWDISKMFTGLSIDRIKQLNGLNSDRITPGQKLKIE